MQTWKKSIFLLKKGNELKIKREHLSKFYPDRAKKKQIT